MPYTPPSHNSPSNSRSESPTISRTSSYTKDHHRHGSPVIFPGGPRSTLPRSTSSASYLHKHRRSPSLIKPQSSSASSIHKDSAVISDGKSVEGGRNKIDVHGSLRRSPPPVNNSLIPVGAIATPPESVHNSSDDDEDTARKVNVRHLENLEELQAAIRVIEQRRASSPTRSTEEAHKTARMALEVVVPQLKKSLDGNSSTPIDDSQPSLSKEARKIAHSRSSTESSILTDLAHQSESPTRTSDESEGDDIRDGIGRSKPAMLRKKSGELVRPALRPPSARRRPSSMPGTPTYSKAVHFDSHLEHVRHFLQVDRPLAVSAGSSPVEQFEADNEFPFEFEGAPQAKGGPLFEWEIKLANFPRDTPERRCSPVYIERIFLSSDNKHIVGVVSVANLAFTKHVAARFTLDYWKTTSEVVADYNNDHSQTNAGGDGRDRFNFSVKLADLANIENKTMSLCVRYNVAGREFWDNNSSMNYQVDFSKKAKYQNGKNGMTGAASRPLVALPRSRPAPNSTVTGRPRSMPVSFDDFSTGTFDSFRQFNQTSVKLVGEPPLRMKKATDEILPDAPTRKTSTNVQAFSTRYDFGASLASAIQATNGSLGDRPGSKQSNNESVSITKPVVSAPTAARHSIPTTETTSTNAIATAPRGRAPGSSPVPGTNGAVPLGPPLFADKPALSSSSYQELVDKYCFFGSAKTSPQQTKPALRPVDVAHNHASSVPAPTAGSVKPTGASHSSPHAEGKSKPTTSKTTNHHMHRSNSPNPATGSGLGSRSTSPISFGYPYHHGMQNGFFAEAHAPTVSYG